MRCCRLLMGQAACCCAEQSCEPPFSVLEVLGKARVAELVDALDLESSGSSVGVQFPPLAPAISRRLAARFPFCIGRCCKLSAQAADGKPHLPSCRFSSLILLSVTRCAPFPSAQWSVACGNTQPQAKKVSAVLHTGRPFFAAPELRMRRACVALLFMVAETVPSAVRRHGPRDRGR